MEELYLFLVFVFGTIIGSFLNVLIWRLPKSEGITGRSHCPHCHHKLAWYDLIPIASFLFSGGKCRYCQKNISWRYFAIELATGALFCAFWILTMSSGAGDWFMLAQWWFIVSVLIVVFVIDLEHYLILDKVVLPATGVILLSNIILDVTTSGWVIEIYSLWFNSLLGMIGGFLPFFVIWFISKGRWMGLGDAKFGLFLGAVFGFPQIWVLYFIAFILGGLFGIYLLVTKQKHLSSKLPFGTFLAVSALITFWYGFELFSWYMSFIGFA